MTEQRVPDADQMRKYLDRGLSQQQIADAWEKDSGIRVSRAAIGLAIARYGLKSSTTRDRFDDLIPWTLSPRHTQHRDARNLRLEGRRRRGLSLTDGEKRRLDNWKDELARLNAVIVYDPATEAGFFLLERDDEIDGPGALIRPWATQGARPE